MTIWKAILLWTGTALTTAGVTWLTIRSLKSKEDDSIIDHTTDQVFFGGLFYSLSVFRDILVGFFACFQKPSRKNAPELMTYGGIFLILFSFSLGD